MILSELCRDAHQLAHAAYGASDRRSVARAVLSNDSYLILGLWRVRCLARRWRVPLLNTLLRRVQTVVFGVEIGSGVTLGHGVYFVHSVGTVIGGNARLGDRVRLMGNNTVGTARDDGYPIVGDDVMLGVGSRILGAVCIGQRAVVGANAVVLCDVPQGALAVGVPARIKVARPTPPDSSASGPNRP